MEKIGLRIRTFGDPLLRKKAEPVAQISDRHRQILSEMAQLMYASGGIGLAAPQVGINESLIVADTGCGLYKLINPRIVKKEGRQVREEGCLSIPGICLKLRRAKKVAVQAQDENSRPLKIEGQDLLACVFQHEIEHLKGKLIVDHVSFWERLKIHRRLKELEGKAKNGNLSGTEKKSCPLQL